MDPACRAPQRFVSRTYIGATIETTRSRSAERKTHFKNARTFRFRSRLQYSRCCFKTSENRTMDESGKCGVALLVGAGDAIGAAVARRFAAGGYSVCVARRDAEKSWSVVQEIIASGGGARAVSTDVRNEEAV